MDGIDEYMRPSIIRITDLHQQFMAKHVSFPLWQREDKWSLSYKQDLIISIMKRRMIPMLFFAELQDETHILDGGHRTRAICGFLNNEFPVDLLRDDHKIPNVYYDLPSQNILTPEEKRHLDNYPLPIYKYTNVTEDDSREIFNELQHFRSMTVAEVCNSHASYLIDYMRNIKDLVIDTDKGRKTIYEIMESRNISYPNPKCHKYLPVLILLFSFFDGDSPRGALNDCKEGKEVIMYVKKFNQDELEESYIQKFEKTLHRHFYFISKLGKSYKASAINSIYHYMVWHEIDDYDTYFTHVKGLLEQASEYEAKLKVKTNLQKDRNDTAAGEITKLLDTYPSHVVSWHDTTVMRGTSYNSGREIRYNILTKLFTYPEISVDFQDVIEPMREGQVI
tara:strand:+ start:1844 stop:3022 length:1179 start_codon:yes stop_codon:yes gene_type:complete